MFKWVPGSASVYTQYFHLGQVEDAQTAACIIEKVLFAFGLC